MRFTKYQYNQAIEALKDAKTQLEADGLGCAICGDSGHQAFGCGHNPLVAMALCRAIANNAETKHRELHAAYDGIADSHQLFNTNLHDIFHYLAGHYTFMGEVTGPRKIVLPPESEEEAAKLLRGES